MMKETHSTSNDSGTVPKKRITLKAFILIACLLVSLVSFLAAFAVTSTIYRNAIANRAVRMAHAVSGQALASMLQLMQKGWTRAELLAFLASFKSSSAEFPYQVDIYRGKTVEALFGPIGQGAIAPNVADVLGSGKASVTTQGYVVQNIYPIKATGQCLACHTNAEEGAVLGAVQVWQNLEAESKSAGAAILRLFLLLSPTPFLMAFIIAARVNSRIERSTKAFHQKIEAVNSVDDITTLDTKTIDLGFAELNAVMDETGLLLQRMKDVAVDKSMLEFELQLLEKFIITSEVVRDWKEHVCHLLLEINKVVDAYTLFTIFKVDNEHIYDLEIFWRGTPSDETSQRIEQTLRDKFLTEGPIAIIAPAVRITHNIADNRQFLAELDEEDLVLQTKSLLLETPQIGGVVGIGVQADVRKNPIRALVIEGILTTLINVVGSIKAIYKYTKELEFYATRDPLTNLFNQRVFWELLHYETGRARRQDYHFPLLVIDFDNFKLVNDRYGHNFGDLFIQTFSTAIRETLREGDIMARYGGDEFALILTEATEEQGYAVAQRIKSAVENLSLEAPDGTKVKGTASLGMAMFPTHAREVKDLFLIADNMMHKAKKEGKNKIGLPTEEDLTETFRRNEEKSIFLLSIVQDKDKIIPFFQPVMDIKTKRIEISELLMRIRKGDRLLPAGEFIEIAEYLGIINKLDYLLIEKAFTKIKEEAYTGTIFINLSPKALIIKEFITNLRRLSRDYQIDPSLVVFEITERETVKNLTLLEKFVRELKFEGFNFAIDDFGSGFSSFHYLKLFPIDYVKIEGEFIKNMIRDSVDMGFVKSIITLAAELNIKLIAEFVENEEILRTLETLKVDYCQGYYIAQPMANLYPKGTILSHFSS